MGKEIEYKVKFDGGLSPRICVYCPNYIEQKLYKVGAYFGTTIEVGNEVGPGNGAERDHKGNVRRVSGSEIKTTKHLSHMTVQKIKNLHPEWESNMISYMEREGINFIKVKDREQINTAIGKHQEAYEKQFTELGEQMEALYEDFVNRHVPIGQYERPVSIMDFDFTTDS